MWRFGSLHLVCPKYSILLETSVFIMYMVYVRAISHGIDSISDEWAAKSDEAHAQDGRALCELGQTKHPGLLVPNT